MGNQFEGKSPLNLVPPKFYAPLTLFYFNEKAESKLNLNRNSREIKRENEIKGA